MKTLAAALLLLALAVPALAHDDASKQSDDILPFPVTEKTLPNGLKVLVVPTGFPNIVSVQIPVMTGSRNEVEPGKSGFAHFFEHMMFRGTPSYPPDKYSALITAAGARQNAYTTDDFTNYHTTFAKEDLEKVLEIEADRFQNLSYSVEAFKTESRAVLGEYNKNSANPIQKLYETMRDKAFTTHTYKHTTMGFLKDIEDMPNQYDYSKTFFDRWYRPANATLIIAGDVDAAKVMPLVEKYWGAWKAGEPAKVEIPQEPPAKGPVYAHVPWPTPTAPWVVVAFHGPAFSEKEKDWAAIDMFMDLNFGDTSPLYRKLVEQDQKVDQMFAGPSANTDPELITIFARVKKQDDVLSVRDEILRTVAVARGSRLPAGKLADAKKNQEYGFMARLDNTEAIAGTYARFVRYRRSHETLNNLYRVYRSLAPADLQAAAQKYLTDANLVVTTLSKDPMPEAMAKLPALATMAPAAGVALDAKQMVIQKSDFPQLRVKLLFDVGSAVDPPGKEGLARLAASMIGDAGSKAMRIDEIRETLFPLSGVISGQVDKEMTTFTMSIHRDNWSAYSDAVLPMLLEPGFGQEDFDRIRTAQKNALTIDLRSNNEEELGKEWLQASLFAGTPYGHPVLGTVAGLDNVTLEDVKSFVRAHYTTGNLKVGIHGAVPDAVVKELQSRLGALPSGNTPRTAGLAAQTPRGLQVDIIEKETRATALSFGHPIDVTRASPDFAALNVARAWLGEHRASMARLYDRIREVRGMNYGDYAYIEAFPRGMFQFYPDPNIARQKQLFEVWVRPVAPENAQMALRIALHEVERMVKNGLTQEQFAASRDYLMKNVYVITSTQNQQIGYALDSDWYGMGEYTKTMRAALQKLTLADVNKAIKRHIRPADFKVVFITKDAAGLKQKLVSDEPSAMKYEAEKPKELLDEDKLIGARKLGIKADQVAIIPVDQVFARANAAGAAAASQNREATEKK
jgi:zinc protease